MTAAAVEPLDAATLSLDAFRDRPVLVLTRDPVADRIGAVVVAALTRTRRGLASELELTEADGVPTASVVNFDNIHTIDRDTFRRRVATLPAGRMAEVTAGR